MMIILFLYHIVILTTLLTNVGAVQHYKSFGSIEHRPSLELKPLHSSWDLAKQKLDDYINILNFMDIPIKRRVLMIYHIESIAESLDSSDIYYNNLYYFISSIPTKPKKDNHGYYIFYLFTSIDENQPEIPISSSNVAHVVWTHNAATLYLQFQTIRYIQRHNFMTNNFYSVFASRYNITISLLS